MNGRWSSAICDRYQIQLTDDLRDWLDDGWDRFESPHEFSQFLSPDSLIQQESSPLWPGFMLPDTLPLVGNRYGDWLCIRIGADDRVSEVIQWYHGGGDYLPFGKNLPEALFYDVCHSSRPDHTHWGEAPKAPTTKPSILEWIARHLRATTIELEAIIGSFREGRIVDGLTAIEERGWCLDAIARDRIDIALSTPLRLQADPKLAMRLGVPWEQEMTRWLFDTDLIPTNYRKRLHELMGPDKMVGLTQTWDVAEAIALQVLQRRNDLAWSSDIAGWAAARRGDYDTAVDRWWQGLKSSVFSDQSTRFRSHWFNRQFGKFSASQLGSVLDHLTPQQKNDEYWQMISSVSHGDVHHRVATYWIQQASKTFEDPIEEYHNWYRAGWDVGCQQLWRFATILDGMHQAAKRAGWRSRAAIANAYRAKLRTAK